MPHLVRVVDRSMQERVFEFVGIDDNPTIQVVANNCLKDGSLARARWPCQHDRPMARHGA